ncbi:hypothetical protein [Methylobacterium sp. CM6247]
MANDIRKQAERWSEIIADAYADAARPAVTSGARALYAAELMPGLERAIAVGVPEKIWASLYVNPVLDRIEQRDGIRGPRLKTVKYEPNAAVMAFDIE